MTASLKQPRAAQKPRERAEPIPAPFRDDPLLWAGWLYAQDGMTQDAIAKVMGVSRATVNGYLAEARARGIMTLSVDPALLSGVRIAGALKRRFGLSECIVVPADDGDRPLALRLGEAAAGLLRVMLRPGDVVGVAWGRTVRAVAESLGPVSLPDLVVAQATGAMSGIAGENAPEACATRMAAALQARTVTVTAPAVVSNEMLCRLIVDEPLVAEQLATARRADKLVFGICSTRPDSMIHAGGLIGKGELADFIRHRATAVIANRFIDDRGHPMHGDLDRRTIGLTLEEMRRIRVRLAVAGGADKSTAILACLRGGHATHLVIDAATGAAVLRADEVPDDIDALRPLRKLNVPGGSIMKTKKLINDPKDVVEEMLSGVIAAHPRHVRQLAESSRSIVAMDAPRQGKVGLLIGGGSGHEPTFVGFVGKGLADGCAVGNIFASPPPDPILEATRAINGGAGVLYMYGNYSGDVMNFDMAAEMAAMDDIEVRTVRTTDDVASAPRDQREKRRGVAGNFFIFKAAGAACDLGWSLDECVRAAEKANARTYTMGVALSPCSMPHTLRHNFEIGPEDMEVGMGIHGEPGIAREKLKSADAVTDEIMDRIFEEMGASAGARVAVLVNSLGSTPPMELYVVNRRVHERLAKKGIAVHVTFVGPYCTSMEMAGCSITVMDLDDELQMLIDHPCDTPALKI